LNRSRAAENRDEVETAAVGALCRSTTVRQAAGLGMSGKREEVSGRPGVNLANGRYKPLNQFGPQIGRKLAGEG
jgi:hypothetical protein